jgi:glycoside/pentoside/hexuronide:cation symporter, GPH family
MKEGFVVPLKEKIAYGLGDLANNLAITAMNFYFIFYIVNVSGLTPLLAGITFWVSRSIAAVTDLMMGIISDRTSSKFGRRRVYLLAGAVPVGVFFLMLWLIPFKDQTGLFIYYLIAMILFNVGLSVVSIPYNSLMPELTQNYDERTSISGYRMAFSFTGNLLAAAGVAVIVDNIFPGRNSYPTSYPIMGIIFGVVVILLYFFTFAFTRERVHAEAELVLGKGFWHELKSLWQVREMRYMISLFVFNQVAADIFMAMVIFFLKDVMKIGDDVTSIVMGLPLIIAVASAPLWVYLGDKMGKRRAYILGAFFYLVPLALILFVPPGSTVMVYVIAVLAGLGSSATQVLPWSMIPDVVEFDEYQNGVRREGFYMGVLQLVYKVASALIIFLATGLLGLFGYVENNPGGQPNEALLAVRLVLGLGTGIFYTIAALFAIRLPLTRERFDEVKRLIAERKSDKTSGTNS